MAFRTKDIPLGPTVIHSIIGIGYRVQYVSKYAEKQAKRTSNCRR